METKTDPLAAAPNPTAELADSVVRAPAAAATLRQRAEAVFLDQAAALPERLASLSPEATQAMLQELQVHQIELELQNEELRRAQAELDASRARYFDLYDLAPMGYCTVSEPGLIVEANLTLATRLGVARGALVAQPFSRFILKEDADIFYLLRKQLLATGQPQTCELRMTPPASPQFWAQLVVAVVPEAAGPPGLRVVLSDITARKQAEAMAQAGYEQLHSEIVKRQEVEQKLRESLAQTERSRATMLSSLEDQQRVEATLRASEKRHRLLVESSPFCIHEIDLNGCLTSMNSAGLKMMGVADEATIRGQAYLPIVAAAERERIGELMHRAFAGQASEFEFVAANGECFQSAFVPLTDDQHKVVRLMGLSQNITARQQAEAAMQESAEQHRALLHTAMDGFWMADAQGRLLEVNEAYCRMSGYAEAELLSLRVADLEASEDLERVAEHIHRLVTKGEDRFEMRHRRKDGGEFDVELSVQYQIASGRTVAFLRDITVRKQAEATLRASEDRYRRLVEDSPDAIGIYQDRKLAFINRTGVRMFGATRPEELTERDFTEIIHPDDQAAASDRVRRRQAGELDVYPAEVRYLRRDGASFMAEVDAAPISYRGRPAVQFIARDITARKAAEEYLARLHQQNELILSAAAEGIMGLDFQGHHTFVNPAAAEMLGYPVEELIGRHSHSLWHHTKPDGRPYPEDECPILATCQDGTLHRAANEVFWRKDGTCFPVEYAARPIFEQDRIAGAVVTFTDITARQQAEALLRLESAALEAAANAIVITDLAGRIEWANGAFSKLTGYPFEEAVGKRLNLLKSGKQSQEFYRNLWDTILAGQVWQGENINRRKNGELYHEEQTITPLHDERGGITHFIAVKQDITARKKLEDQYRQSQKMEAFGQLAGGVAHDFNNLLNVILGNAELVALGDLSENQAASLEEIRLNGERAATLTRQLLSFSRRDTHYARAVDLNEIVSGMNKMLHRIIGEDFVLETQLWPEGAPVQADPSGLELVVLNLVVNARAAMPEGGEIVITVAPVHLDATTARHLAARPGEFIRLSVRDTGCGIPPEILPRIFEPFFTTKDVGKGTGLGLATVHGIIEQHHGWIEVESAPGQGTTFHIYLPRRSDAALASPASQEPGLVRGGTETILMVEDEPALRRLTCRILRDFGYRVLEVSTGLAALELWPQHRAEVALLLTDVIMPEGISGGQLAEQLLAQKPGLKVVYISGYPGGVAGRGLSLREGVNFLKKPYSSTQLGRIIRDRLDAAPET